MTREEAIKLALDRTPRFDVSDDDLVLIWEACEDWVKNGQKPVLYQLRMQPMWTDSQPWSAWEICSPAGYANIKKVPELADWRYESRALYTHPDLHLEAEDAECTHLCLDDCKVPRFVDGKELSLWGRVLLFKNQTQESKHD